MLNDHEHVDILSPAPPVLVKMTWNQWNQFSKFQRVFFASRGASTSSTYNSSNSSLANMELKHAETWGLNFSHTKVFL